MTSVTLRAVQVFKGQSDGGAMMRDRGSTLPRISQEGSKTRREYLKDTGLH